MVHVIVQAINQLMVSVKQLEGVTAHLKIEELKVHLMNETMTSLTIELIVEVIRQLLISVKRFGQFDGSFDDGRIDGSVDGRLIGMDFGISDGRDEGLFYGSKMDSMTLMVFLIPQMTESLMDLITPIVLLILLDFLILMVFLMVQLTE